MPCRATGGFADVVVPPGEMLSLLGVLGQSRAKRVPNRSANPVVTNAVLFAGIGMRNCYCLCSGTCTSTCSLRGSTAGPRSLHGSLSLHGGRSAARGLGARAVTCLHVSACTHVRSRAQGCLASVSDLGGVEPPCLIGNAPEWHNSGRGGKRGEHTAGHSPLALGHTGL